MSYAKRAFHAAVRKTAELNRGLQLQAVWYTDCNSPPLKLAEVLRPPRVWRVANLHSSLDFGPILGEVCSKPPNLQRHRRQEGVRPSCWRVVHRRHEEQLRIAGGRSDRRSWAAGAGRASARREHDNDFRGGRGVRRLLGRP